MSDQPEQASSFHDGPTPEEERGRLTYEGIAVPLFIVFIWLGFLAFGFLYFSSHLL